MYGSTNASDYNISLQWFGGQCAYNFNALIFAHNLTNVSVTGSNDDTYPGNSSIVDGVGWKWWCEAQCTPLHQQWCDKMNPTNAALPKYLLPSPQGAGRPRLVNVFNCTDVTLAGFTAQNSPHWTVHIQNSNRVLIQNMTVLSPRAVGKVQRYCCLSCCYPLLWMCAGAFAFENLCWFVCRIGAIPDIVSVRCMAGMLRSIMEMCSQG